MRVNHAFKIMELCTFGCLAFFSQAEAQAANSTNGPSIEQKYITFYSECLNSELTSIAKTLLRKNNKGNNFSDSEIANALASIGAANLERGYFPAAESLSQCVLAIRLGSSSPNSNNIASALNNLGVAILQGRGDLAEA